MYDDIQSIDGEEWKEIIGTNGKYYISNLGRIKSFCQYNARLLQPIENENGYLRVSISGKWYYIHRLVGYAFITNDDTENKTTIDHIDTDRHNNNADNL